MDEITDQFRTEDAEEFKQIQAELELAGLPMKKDKSEFHMKDFILIFV